MTFQRWQCNWPRTWPYVLFKKHHTELNHLYWSGAAAISHAKSSTAHSNPALPLSNVLHVTAANSRRMNFSVGQWHTHFSEFENWSRLSALMSLSGYFETFLYSISWLALSSDPGVLLSSPRAVDGIALIKQGRSPDISAQTTGLTKGDWTARCRLYQKLFTTVPPALQASIADLEQMRKLRNGVGHSFGRFINEYRDPLIKKPAALQRLSEARLQRWLGIVENCAIEVEEHLRCQHIGGFEVLLSYHRWDKNYKMGHMTEERAFRATIPDAQGNPPPARYFREAINYYNRA